MARSLRWRVHTAQIHRVLTRLTRVSSYLIRFIIMTLSFCGIFPYIAASIFPLKYLGGPPRPNFSRGLSGFRPLNRANYSRFLRSQILSLPVYEEYLIQYIWGKPSTCGQVFASNSLAQKLVPSTKKKSFSS